MTQSLFIYFMRVICMVDFFNRSYSHLSSNLALSPNASWYPVGGMWRWFYGFMRFHFRCIMFYRKWSWKKYLNHILHHVWVIVLYGMSNIKLNIFSKKFTWRHYYSYSKGRGCISGREGFKTDRAWPASGIANGLILHIWTQTFINSKLDGSND